MKYLTLLATLSTLSLTACGPVQITAGYSPPESSGLVGVRPYPTPDDVCQVIGENELTSDYLDHTTVLIGCPVSEAGAIRDRLSEGGERLETIGDWVLLLIPE